MENPSSTALRRRRTRRLVRRLTLGLGVAMAFLPTSTDARERATSSPRRTEGAAPPPWLEPGGNPPRLPGSTEGKPSIGGHPALHGRRSAQITPLFPRESRRSDSGDERKERDAAMARHPSGKNSSRTEIVRSGDSLWAIAAERVGDDRADECWPEIYRANREAVGRDPHHIEPGQTLTIPEECR